MATGGNLVTFEEKEERWSDYVDRLEQYFISQEITMEEKRKAALITRISLKLYRTLASLCQPEKPATKMYAQLVTLLMDYLCPKPSIYVERNTFHNARQLEDESVVEFIARLKQLSSLCEFGANLSEVLRDKIVCALRSEEIKQRLLAENVLTLDSVIKLATAWEKSYLGVPTLAEKTLIGERNTFFVQGMSKKGNGGIQAWNKEENGGRQRRARKMEEESSEGKYECYCCGKKGHVKSNCRFRDYKCNFCQMKGHLMQCCRKKQGLQMRKPSWQRSMRPEDVHETETTDEEEEQRTFNVMDRVKSNVLYNFVREGNDKMCNMFEVEVIVGGTKLKLDIDTGSSNTVISQSLYKKKFARYKLKKSGFSFKYYTGQTVRPVGYFETRVTHKKMSKDLPLYVMEGGGRPLMGRDWLEVFQIFRQEKELNKIQPVETIKKLMDKYKQVFSDEVGIYKGAKAKLFLKNTANPVFCRPRSLPFALKEKVEAEIDRLVKAKILVPVNHSEWATPVVPVLKSNGSVRLCGDYKITVNRFLQVDCYPVPKINELLANLGEGQLFTKLDLSQAYQQLELHENSKELVTINTHKGLFQYERMPYGIASAPAIFQRLMESLVKGIPGVTVFLDDLLITGETEEQHLERLEQLLSKLEEAGLTLQKDKCSFFQTKVSYLGYEIDKEGVHTSKEKIEAIVKAPEPKNVKQLQAILGLINYYAKFVPNLAVVLDPLYKLLKKKVSYVFDDNCKKAFKKIKESLVEAPILAHFDPGKKLKLTCDASSYGIGAILSQMGKEGVEVPVAYASRTLNQAERNYSAIDREALSIYWAVHKFYQYVYGQKFTLVTDHKPLVSIFGPKKGIPQMGACRLQRYALFLSTFQFDIEYTKSDENPADALSRLPVQNTEKMLKGASYLNMIEEADIPISYKEIKLETGKDEILNKVLKYVKIGWPNNLKVEDKELEAFWKRKEEITLEQEVLMWGYRVIIPSKFRERLLHELHSMHFGIVKMKSLARTYLWWPRIDHDVEKFVGKCKLCYKEKNSPPMSTLHHWEYPKKPFERVHVDFLGPIKEKIIFVLTDAYSKWVEASVVRSTSADQVIPVMRGILARMGLPKLLVSDNGPPFTGEKFESFLKQNGIRHTFSPPYHPATNGLAENGVKTLKRKIIAAMEEGQNANRAINNFLLAYRTTVHSTTNETPAKLCLGRELRTRLDLLRPDLQERVQIKNEKQTENFRGGRVKQWKVNDRVMVRDYTQGKRSWTAGIVEEILGPVTYAVKVNDKVWKRHCNQIVDDKREVEVYIGSEKGEVEERREVEEVVERESVEGERRESVEGERRESVEEERRELVEGESSKDSVEGQRTEKVVERRYPLRIRVPKKIIDV